MRNIILLIIVPLVSYSQDLNSALNMHNTIRGYYDLKPLITSDSLNLIAKERANVLSKQDKITFTKNGLGENVFYTSYLVLSRDYFLEATVGWILEDFDEVSIKQILCLDCKEIGFGVSMNDDKVYVVAVYDKIYEIDIRKKFKANSSIKKLWISNYIV